MSEQGVQEGTQYTPLRGPSFEDQRSGCVTYPYHLGRPVRMSRIQFVQVRKGSVECNRDYILCGSVGSVSELEWV